jgi:hypothetical protein
VGVALGAGEVAVPQQLAGHEQCLALHHRPARVGVPQIMQPERGGEVRRCPHRGPGRIEVRQTRALLEPGGEDVAGVALVAQGRRGARAVV